MTFLNISKGVFKQIGRLVEFFLVIFFTFLTEPTLERGLVNRKSG